MPFKVNNFGARIWVFVLSKLLIGESMINNTIIMLLLNKYLFVAVLVAFISGSYAQNPEGDKNYTDSKGLKQGSWRKLDNQGRVIYEGQFKDNIPQGSFVYYNEEGKVRSRLNYSTDGKVAIAVNFHPNGKKMAEGTYRETKKSGVWKYYNDKETISAEEIYQDGKPTGVWKKFYDDGKLLEECPYVNGVKEGILKQYFTDGELKSIIHFSKGKYEGKAEFYYVGGKPMQVGQFSDDMKHGLWISYKSNGEMESEILYEMGQVVTEKYYDKARENELFQESKAIPE